MRGRNADGTFQADFSPYRWGGPFTEGNSWHYTWSVFHDVQGLVDAMGGEESFTQMLDSVFVVPPIYDDAYYGFRIHEIAEMQVADMGNYAHGNQPAWKGQQHIRETMDRLYRATPDGYCGDEDNGQTSAWYVFSALGFYPVCPASTQYALGTPLFQKAVVTRPDGKQFTIEAPEGRQAVYHRSPRKQRRGLLCTVDEAQRKELDTQLRRIRRPGAGRQAAVRHGHETCHGPRYKAGRQTLLIQSRINDENLWESPPGHALGRKAGRMQGRPVAL